MPGWSAIFDWDGVIVDTSRYHESSWERLAAEEGRCLPAGHFKRGFGMKNDRIIPEILGWSDDPGEIARLGRRKEALFRELVRAGGLSALPGVREWIARLARALVPRAIASSTERANIACCLELLGLGPRFDAAVSAEDVARGKPDPDVFLRAAEALGVDPRRCVVFEDALMGIRAARAAGMRVVAVATTHPAVELREADRVVERLDELRPRELGRWFRR